MKLNRSTGYALLAVGYIAKNQEKKLVLSHDIAKEYDIPLEYLLKILKDMAKVNVLRSKRGPRGGFCLAKAPSKISLLEIIEAVEGPIENQFQLSDFTKKDKLGSKADKACEKALNQGKAVLSKTRVSALIA